MQDMCGDTDNGSGSVNSRHSGFEGFRTSNGSGCRREASGPKRIFVFRMSMQELAQEPNGFLIDIFGIRSEAIKELAEQEGIELEALSLLKKHGLTAERLENC